MYDKPYEAPILVVDSIIFQLNGNQLSVLLIRRDQEPFKDSWALPGGYNPAGETTIEAMTRILQTKTGVELAALPLVEQLFTFDTVARDPRGHAVSVSYMGLGKNITPKESKTTQKPRFFLVSDLPELAYDHRDIIKYAHERLQAKIAYTNAIYGLVSEELTLTELQTAYEAVLCRPLDKRNFRKKFLSLGLIEATDRQRQDGAHRPARLYRFCQSDLQTLTRSFE